MKCFWMWWRYYVKYTSNTVTMACLGGVLCCGCNWTGLLISLHFQGHTFNYMCRITKRFDKIIDTMKKWKEMPIIFLYLTNGQLSSLWYFFSLSLTSVLNKLGCLLRAYFFRTVWYLNAMLPFYLHIRPNDSCHFCSTFFLCHWLWY